MRISKHIVPVVLFGTAFAFAYAVAMTRSIPDSAAAADIGGPVLRFAAEGDSGAERRTPAASAEIAVSRMSESKGPSIPASVRPPGTPVPRGEPLAALTALEAAAANGQAQAGWKLARMYADGDSVPKSHLRAFEYFRTVADINAEEPPESPQARYVANAFVALGNYYLDGIPNSDIKADPARAREMFAYAAAYFGDPEAQYQLGRMYLEGKGGRREPKQAARWLTLAAKKGEYRAQAVLGSMLFNGEYVPRQAPQGLMWLTVANDAASPQETWIADLHAAALKEATDDERAVALVYLERWLKGR